jgi:hypothetical protein
MVAHTAFLTTARRLPDLPSEPNDAEPSGV